MAQDEVDSALKALENAIITEREGRRFYEEAARRTSDTHGKEMFKALVHDEEGHSQILEAEYSSLAGGRGWVDVKTARETQVTGSRVRLFPQEASSSRLDVAKAISDLQVLEMAMDFERQGYHLYNQAAAQTNDTNAKAVYEHLAKEENKHFTLLQETHDYLSNNGMWYFDNLEKPIFEG